jgi:hypothetical protein
MVLTIKTQLYKVVTLCLSVSTLSAMEIERARPSILDQCRSLEKELIVVLTQDDLQNALSLLDNGLLRRNGEDAVLKHILFFKFFLLATNVPDLYSQGSILSRRNQLTQPGAEERARLIRRLDDVLFHEKISIDGQFRGYICQFLLSALSVFEHQGSINVSRRRFFELFTPTQNVLFKMIDLLNAIDPSLRTPLRSFLTHLYEECASTIAEHQISRAIQIHRESIFSKEIGQLLSQKRALGVYQRVMQPQDGFEADIFAFLKKLDHQSLEKIQFMLAAPRVSFKETMVGLIVKIARMAQGRQSFRIDNSHILQRTIEHILTSRKPSQALCPILARCIRQECTGGSELDETLLMVAAKLDRDDSEKKIETQFDGHQSRKRKRDDEPSAVSGDQLSLDISSPTPETLEDLVNIATDEELETQVSSLVRKSDSTFLQGLILDALALLNELEQDSTRRSGYLQALYEHSAAEKAKVQQIEASSGDNREEYERLRQEIHRQIQALLHLDEETDK